MYREKLSRLFRLSHLYSGGRIAAFYEKVIPTFFEQKPVVICFFRNGRDNQKVGITILCQELLTRIASIGSVATLPTNGFPFVSWGSPQTPE